ncbi:MAG: hypothetical protein ACETWR_09155, partial [Anaerolineae bacterium]
MPDKTEPPELAPSDREVVKPVHVLKGPVNLSLQRRRKPTPWVVGISAACLLLAIGLAWLFFSNYRIAIVIEPRYSQITPTAQGVPTGAGPGPIPTDTVTPSTPAPSAAATAVATENMLAQANAGFQRALEERDRQQVQAVLDLLVEVEAADPAAASEVASLRSQAYYALDALTGTVYLDVNNTTHWALTTTDGRALTHPIDLTISHEGIYVIDSGTLYRGDLSALTPGGRELALTAILTAATQIGGYPVKEIVAVEATNTDAVYVLDKSNDMYRYQIGSSSSMWRLERPQASEYDHPDPLYLNISTYSDRLYILDPARNQIWRHPPDVRGAGFLPGTLPWLMGPGEPDVSSGIDLAIDGNIYVLWRDGTVVTHVPDEIARFDLAKAEGLSHVQGLEVLPSHPVAIFANVEGIPLYVADPGRRRVVVFDRRDGSLLRQFVAPDNLDFSALHGIAEREGYLYMLAGANLYGYDLSTGITGTV